jgi:hypothetical protein
MLKWVGAITAILTLVFGIQQLMQRIADIRDRERQVAELTDTGLRQQQAGDYESAWNSFDAAAKAAQTGGLLAKIVGRPDAHTLRLRLAREDLAMKWLENARASGNRTFSDLVGRLQPVLDLGVASAQPVRKADMLAHIGWGYFLRSRDGHDRLDPEPQYREALAADAANPYAHAYLGHWLAWAKRDLKGSREQFAAGVAAGRETPYVRSLQLAAYANLGSEGDAEYVAAVNDMYRRHEPVDGEAQRETLSNFYEACRQASDGPALRKSLADEPANELLDTFRTLGSSEETKGRRLGQEVQQASCDALLLEAADRKPEALAAWKAIRGTGKKDSVAYAKASAGVSRLAAASKP